MTPVYIAGISTTVFGRHLDRPVCDLARDALEAAVKDAGCSVSDIGVAFYSGITQGRLQGQVAIPGHVVLGRIGIDSIPIFNVESACASGSAAFHLAVQSLRSGSTDVALVLGSEKMNILDKSRAFSLLEGGWDVARCDENRQVLERGWREGVEMPEPLHDLAAPGSTFMAIAAGAVPPAHEALRDHAAPDRRRVRQEPPALGAQPSFAGPQDASAIDEILAAPAGHLSADSADVRTAVRRRRRGHPVHRGRRCSRIGADRSRCYAGSSASVLRSFARRRIDQPEQRRGATSRPTRPTSRQGLDRRTWTWPRYTTSRPWARSSRSRTSASCQLGKVALLRSVANSRLGGRLPVNTSGGLESRGHPLGATGLAQLHELATQLRGEAGSAPASRRAPRDPAKRRRFPGGRGSVRGDPHPEPMTDADHRGCARDMRAWWQAGLPTAPH